MNVGQVFNLPGSMVSQVENLRHLKTAKKVEKSVARLFVTA
jgi:hypothetical protein